MDAQDHASDVQPVELRAKLELAGSNQRTLPPAVIWLEAMPGTTAPAFTPGRHYTLLQKNRTFSPHLQVVPVGAKVDFPNADPFFHNVFSLYNGKRFDLGLYEAGTSKTISFQREGVSYIFCNIHPEMSAVVISLTNPLYAVAAKNGAFIIQNVPMGDYLLHLWLEGGQISATNSVTRKVHVAGHNIDLGALRVQQTSLAPATHTNKFDQSYPVEPSSSYP
jgi:plastocyanin